MRTGVPAVESKPPVTNSQRPLSAVDSLISRGSEFELVVQVAPGAAGPNHFDVYLEDFTGTGPEVAAVTLSFKFLDSDGPTFIASAAAAHPDHYVLDGDELGQAGRWVIGVRVGRQGVADILAAFQVLVPPAS